MTRRDPARRSAARSAARQSYRLPVLVVLAVFGWTAVSVQAGWAQAAGSEQTEQVQFIYGVDNSSWFWEPQSDEELALGPVSQRASLPSPQSQDTLPVAAEFGEPTKVSALRFDLTERGVPEGSTVTRFVLTIAEGTLGAGDLVPTVNLLDNEVQACALSEPFSPGEADLWSARPAVSGDCVTGARDEVSLDDEEDIAVYWTFDLTPLATSWGESPFDNHGVEFSPVLPEDAGITESWQVNLKLPQRNDVNTPVNEYEETADRVTVELSYMPGESGDDGAGQPPPPATTAGTAGAAGGASSGSGAGVPDRGAPPEAALPEEGHPTDAAPVALGDPFEPRMPWYVWLLIPGALLAAALVRGALVEAPAAARGSGVIEAIRRNNALRRGGPLAAPASMLCRQRATMPVGRGR